jgi:methylenetetrahydrofolate dehydrogenase (NADP+) / methenyltetrahydrofolate cyclohydrolase
MTATLIDGEAIAREVRDEVRLSVESMTREGTRPGLAGVVVGEDPASLSYLRGKTRACAEVGIDFQLFRLPVDASPDALFGLLHDLNANRRFHGILVQQPVPAHIDRRKVLQAVSPEKDVDGLHPLNAGLLLQGLARFVPCTPAGIQQMLLRRGYDPAGKRVVIVGRSNLVGKPLAALLMQQGRGANATVTVCHSATRDLPAITRQAEILVAAVGHARSITADMVGEGVVVVDVGINRVDDPSRKQGYRLAGDVDFEPVAEKAAAITPVPGGVGPMTVAMLLANTLTAASLAARSD